MSHAAGNPFFSTADEFMAWAEREPGRWELHDGPAMAPERTGHARIKANVYVALRQAIERAGSSCEALLDGPMVPGPGLRRFKPDVIVVCGPRIEGDLQVVENPTIIVEVTSPSTEQVDSGLKLGSYLPLQSVFHYVVTATASRTIIHHRRWEQDQLLTAIVSGKRIESEPLGFGLDTPDVHAGTDLARR